MDQQTPDQGWLELQAQIEGFFDQVLRVEKEKALPSRIANRLEVKKGIIQQRRVVYTKLADHSNHGGRTSARAPNHERGTGEAVGHLRPAARRH
jgi:hypothetical protein